MSRILLRSLICEGTNEIPQEVQRIMHTQRNVETNSQTDVQLAYSTGGVVNQLYFHWKKIICASLDKNDLHCSRLSTTCRVLKSLKGSERHRVLIETPCLPLVPVIFSFDFKVIHHLSYNFKVKPLSSSQVGPSLIVGSPSRHELPTFQKVRHMPGAGKNWGKH